jgi:hypothetical protein
MTTPNLEDLAVRVEQASGPDRELDCLIWCAELGIRPEWQGQCLVAGIEGVIGWIDPGEHQRNFHTNRSATGPASVPAYTASLDAAMTLLDQYGVLLHLSDIGADGLPYARVGRPDLDEAPIFTGISSGVAKDATPTSGLALALCAAALRARSEYKGGEG